MNETDFSPERLSQRILLHELIEKLAAGSWEESEIESATNELELAINDPDTYLSKNPDEAWIVEVCDRDRAEYGYLLQLMTLLSIFTPLSASGDKADEIADSVVELFDDLELSFPTTRKKQNYEWYETILNNAIAQIQPEKSGFGLLYFHQPIDDNLHLIPVYRTDIDRILEISDRFGFKISKSFDNPSTIVKKDD
jgi:hypothetical protein